MLAEHEARLEGLFVLVAAVCNGLAGFALQLDGVILGHKGG